MGGYESNKESRAEAETIVPATSDTGAYNVDDSPTCHGLPLRCA